MDPVAASGSASVRAPLDGTAPAPIHPPLVRRWRALAPRSRGTSLHSILGEDRALLWATVILVVAAWVPLGFSTFLPFSDLGINTASAELILDTALGRPGTAEFYRVQWAPVPYWTTYGACALLGRIVGPLMAAKLLTAAILALVPLGTMRLLAALGRDARLGLWAFALGWEHNLYAGWMALMLGVALTSFALAWLLEAESLADGLRIAPIAALIGLTHIQATWLFGLAGSVLVLGPGPWRRRALIHGAAFLGTAAVVLPWLWMTVHPGGGGGASAAAAPPTESVPFAFEWHTPSYKLGHLFEYTLDNFSRPSGERAAAFAFVVLLLGPLLLGLLPRRGKTDPRAPALLLAVPCALYAFLPWAISGPINHWYTYPRFSTVVLLWLLLIPLPRLRGWSTLALAPGILAALWLDACAMEQLASFAEKTRPFLEVIAAVPDQAAVLAIVNDDNDADSDLKLPPYHQFYAYITAFRHGYSPQLWYNNSIPLVYRPTRGRPAPGWGAPFSMDLHGRYYDDILVQGFEHGDPVSGTTTSDGSRRARLVLERARWRLYAVEKVR